jgi:hypothetical protein
LGGCDGRRSAAVRLASTLHVALGLAFAIATPIVLAYDARQGELPMTRFGFRLLSGPYRSVGTDALTPLGKALGWTLVGSSVLDVVAGIWLWEGRRRGAILGLATAPLSLALGIAFALPGLLIGVPLRALLLIASWRHLRDRQRSSFIDAAACAADLDLKWMVDAAADHDYHLTAILASPGHRVTGRSASRSCR